MTYPPIVEFKGSGHSWASGIAAVNMHRTGMIPVAASCLGRALHNRYSCMGGGTAIGTRAQGGLAAALLYVNDTLTYGGGTNYDVTEPPWSQYPANRAGFVFHGYNDYPYLQPLAHGAKALRAALNGYVARHRAIFTAKSNNATYCSESEENWSYQGDSGLISSGDYWDYSFEVGAWKMLSLPEEYEGQPVGFYLVQNSVVDGAWDVEIDGDVVDEISSDSIVGASAAGRSESCIFHRLTDGLEPGEHEIRLILTSGIGSFDSWQIEDPRIPVVIGKLPYLHEDTTFNTRVDWSNAIIDLVVQDHEPWDRVTVLDFTPQMSPNFGTVDSVNDRNAWWGAVGNQHPNARGHARCGRALAKQVWQSFNL